jgi:hypothetical protein
MVHLILAAALSLQGTWQKACETTEEDSQIRVLQITDKEMTQTFHYFEEDNCQGKEWLKIEFISNYAKKNEDLDLELQSVKATSGTDATTTGLNSISYCGYSDWKTGESKDISGRQCSDGTAPAKGTKTYSKIKQENNQLWLGKFSAKGDGRSIPTRHAIFEQEPFLKVSP